MERLTDPRHTDLYGGARTWMTGHSLHPEPDAYLEHGYVDLCLTAWPTAAGAPLQLATQWALLIWLLDDIFDQELADAEPAAVLAFARSLQAATAHQPTSADHVAVRALANLARQTQAMMPRRWWNRYQQELLSWVHAARVKAVDYVQPGRVPTLREYQMLRPTDGGMLLAAHWCELAEQVVTPAWNDPLVQDLLGAFSACGYLANDLAALAEERFTAVAALVRTTDCSRLDARDLVESMLRAEEERFWWARTALSDVDDAQPRSGAGPVRDTSQFARNLDRFRQALSEWTSASSRYALAAPAEAS